MPANLWMNEFSRDVSDQRFRVVGSLDTEAAIKPRADMMDPPAPLVPFHLGVVHLPLVSSRRGDGESSIHVHVVERRGEERRTENGPHFPPLHNEPRNVFIHS